MAALHRDNLSMKRLLLPALLGLALAAPAARATDETPLDALPYTPSLDVSVMDRTADPCDDLYRYALSLIHI